MDEPNVEMTKEQEAVIIQAAIKAIKAHDPSLESYCRDQLAKQMKRFDLKGQLEDWTPAHFMAQVPKYNLKPKASIVMKEKYAKLRAKLEKRLSQITKK